MIKKQNYLKDNDPNALFWDKGFKKGNHCAQHPDKVIQEKWNGTVLWGLWTYAEFKSWQRGYLFGKKALK